MLHKNESCKIYKETLNNIEANLDVTNSKTNLVKTIVDAGMVNSSEVVGHAEILKEGLDDLDIETNNSNATAYSNEANLDKGDNHVKNSFAEVDDQVEVTLFEVNFDKATPNEAIETKLAKPRPKCKKKSRGIIKGNKKTFYQLKHSCKS